METARAGKSSGQSVFMYERSVITLHFSLYRKAVKARRVEKNQVRPGLGALVRRRQQRAVAAAAAEQNHRARWHVAADICGNLRALRLQ